MTREEAMARLAEGERTIGTAAVYGELTSPRWGEYLARHVPGHMHYGVAAWVLFGNTPGSFLQAVIRGDLFDACRCADDINRSNLYGYVMFFVNGAPMQCKEGDALTTWKGLWPAEVED